MFHWPFHVFCWVTRASTTPLLPIPPDSVVFHQHSTANHGHPVGFHQCSTPVSTKKYDHSATFHHIPHSPTTLIHHIPRSQCPHSTAFHKSHSHTSATTNIPCSHALGYCTKLLLFAPPRMRIPRRKIKHTPHKIKARVKFWQVQQRSCRAWPQTA